MQVRLYYHALVKLRGYENGAEVEIPEGSTVSELYDILGIDKRRRSGVVMTVNGEPVWNSTILREKDEARLLASVGGG